MVAFPTATRKSAFITGFSLVLFIAVLESLASFGVLPIGASEKQLFPIVLVFFFVSVLLFVIDVKSLLAPNELKTKKARPSKSSSAETKNENPSPLASSSSIGFLAALDCAENSSSRLMAA